jgi:hypothetical protein
VGRGGGRSTTFLATPGEKEELQRRIYEEAMKLNPTGDSQTSEVNVTASSEREFNEKLRRDSSQEWSTTLKAKLNAKFKLEDDVKLGGSATSETTEKQTHTQSTVTGSSTGSEETLRLFAAITEEVYFTVTVASAGRSPASLLAPRVTPAKVEQALQGAPLGIVKSVRYGRVTMISVTTRESMSKAGEEFARTVADAREEIETLTKGGGVFGVGAKTTETRSQKTTTSSEASRTSSTKTTAGLCEKRTFSDGGPQCGPKPEHVETVEQMS